MRNSLLFKIGSGSLLVFLCIVLSTIELFAQKQLTFNEGDTYEFDCTRYLFKVRSKGKNPIVTYYDADLNKLDNFNGAFSPCKTPIYEEKFAYQHYHGISYQDNQGQLYFLQIGKFTNYNPDNSELTIYSAPNNSGSRKKISAQDIDMPLNNADKLIYARKDKGRHVMKCKFERLNKYQFITPDNAENFYVYRMGAVDGEFQVQVYDFDFMSKKNLSTLDLTYEVKGAYCLNFKFYGRYKENELNGFNSIALFAKNLPLTDYTTDNLSVVFTSYNLDGSIAAQKQYALPYLFRKSYTYTHSTYLELHQFGAIWPLSQNVYNHEGIFAMIFTGNSTIFINDKMEVEYERKDGKKLEEGILPPGLTLSMQNGIFGQFGEAYSYGELVNYFGFYYAKNSDRMIKLN